MTKMMLTAPMYRLFFAAAHAAVIDNRATYDAEVAEWYATGPGASPEWVEAGTQDWFDWSEEFFDDPSRLVNIGGKGYRFPSCIHGSSLITDYDNICGGCEDGAGVIEEARAIARDQWRRFSARFDWIGDMPSDFPVDMREATIKWAFSLLPQS